MTASMPEAGAAVLAPSPRVASSPKWLFQGALVATLLVPPALFAGRAIADALISLIAVAFLIVRLSARDWSWLEAPHIRLSLIFWLWVVICTLATGTLGAIGQGAAVVRLFLFAAALETWLLCHPAQRRQLWYVVFAVACWLVLQTWQQYFFGANIFAAPRWASGVLTGPFFRPRAGVTLQALYFPAFLPPAMALLRNRRTLARLGGALVLIVPMLTMVVIGQRMPMLLLLFGLVLTGLLLPQFRLAIIGGLIVFALALALAPKISPTTYATLVVVFVHRMENFWSTPYALLYERATVMIAAHPWLGLGFDGFRNHCNDPQYFQTLPWLPVTHVTDPNACSIHPHNYWLQIATSAGIPGLVLFAVLCGQWLVRIGAGVVHGRSTPIQVGLFVAFCVAFWPIASTTSLFTLPNAGWIFLTIGWGLAEQRPQGYAP